MCQGQCRRNWGEEMYVILQTLDITPLLHERLRAIFKHTVLLLWLDINFMAQNTCCLAVCRLVQVLGKLWICLRTVWRDIGWEQERYRMYSVWFMLLHSFTLVYIIVLYIHATSTLKGFHFTVGFYILYTVCKLLKH